MATASLADVKMEEEEEMVVDCIDQDELKGAGFSNLNNNLIFEANIGCGNQQLRFVVLGLADSDGSTPSPSGRSMLCWPQLAEQQVTSIWIGEVWRIGIDMKDTCERSIVEEMIRRLMEEGDERKEILRSVERFSKLARVAISESGSSYDNLDKLIQDLRNL
ncbi:hypothetical protein DVH24_026668 [Malus domestica]|uniref:Uncharacterized protein n=1 Tax=Malus domestica TaxID=3750 RepID=A0A498K419_MALDO|nr:hypothetical protein DVH24_026668 [Malus domestica]